MVPTEEPHDNSLSSLEYVIIQKESNEEEGSDSSPPASPRQTSRRSRRREERRQRRTRQITAPTCHNQQKQERRALRLHRQYSNPITFAGRSVRQQEIGMLILERFETTEYPAARIGDDIPADLTTSMQVPSRINCNGYYNESNHYHHEPRRHDLADGISSVSSDYPLIPPEQFRLHSWPTSGSNSKETEPFVSTEDNHCNIATASRTSYVFQSDAINSPPVSRQSRPGAYIMRGRPIGSQESPRTSQPQRPQQEPQHEEECCAGSNPRQEGDEDRDRLFCLAERLSSRTFAVWLQHQQAIPVAISITSSSSSSLGTTPSSSSRPKLQRQDSCRRILRTCSYTSNSLQWNRQLRRHSSDPTALAMCMDAVVRRCSSMSDDSRRSAIQNDFTFNAIPPELRPLANTRMEAETDHLFQIMDRAIITRTSSSTGGSSSSSNGKFHETSKNTTLSPKRVLQRISKATKATTHLW